MLTRDKNISQFSIAELIEAALQLDVGMYRLLPNEWQNPGIAGLCAFRILAVELHKHDAELSPEVSAFLDLIDKTSDEALKVLRAEGTKAFIKPKINKLFEYAGGFKLENYAEDQIAAIKHALAEEKVSNVGQLVYRKSDKTFFVLVNPGYIDVPQKIYGKKDYPRAALKHAHVSVNEGMKKDESEKLFEKYKAQWGITNKPLYHTDIEGIEYLNKTVAIDVVGAYQGIPKTNSRMAATHQLQVESPELNELAKLDGLRCPFPGYTHHITFVEQSRAAHAGLDKVKSVTELLGNDALSKQLKVILASSVVSKEQSDAKSITQLAVKPSASEITSSEAVAVKTSAHSYLSKRSLLTGLAVVGAAGLFAAYKLINKDAAMTVTADLLPSQRKL